VQCDADLSKAREDLRKCRDEKETLSNRAQGDDAAAKHKAELEKKDALVLELKKQVEALKGEISSMKAKEVADEEVHVEGTLF
jgi:hypothetical protein